MRLGGSDLIVAQQTRHTFFTGFATWEVSFLSDLRTLKENDEFSLKEFHALLVSASCIPAKGIVDASSCSPRLAAKAFVKMDTDVSWRDEVPAGLANDAAVSHRVLQWNRLRYLPTCSGHMATATRGSEMEGIPQTPLTVNDHSQGTARWISESIPTPSRLITPLTLTRSRDFGNPG